MAQGRRQLVVSQAVLFAASASANQIRWYIHTGDLRVGGRQKEPAMPYDPDALKALVASGRMG